jgi:hypothetical protein
MHGAQRPCVGAFGFYSWCKPGLDSPCPNVLGLSAFALLSWHFLGILIVIVFFFCDDGGVEIAMT